MANLYQLDRFRIEFHQEYNLDPTSLEYQQTQSTWHLGSNISDRGRMPHTITPMISPSISVDWTNYHESPEAEHGPTMNEWNETQIPFSHDWGETGTAYGELNPDMTQTDIYPPSQLCWLPGNLQSDCIFDSIPFPASLLESYDHGTALTDSWNYPTPGLSPLSADDDQYNNLCEPNAMLDTPHSSTQHSKTVVYICEICSRIYPKQHLLNDHKKIHDKLHTCPVKSCLHRTAKSRDMERHVRAKHPDYVKAQALPTPPRPLCPVAGCKYGRRGFARKDHLRRHLQRAHPDRLP